MKEIYEGYKPHIIQQEMHQLVIEGNWNEYYFILSRQTGKSKFCEQQILYYLINNKNFNIGYFTPTFRLSKKIFRELSLGLKDWNIIKSFNKTDLQIEFKNGSLLTFFSVENSDNIRGITLDIAILDECAFFSDDIFEQIIKPTLIVKNGKSIGITTPKSKNWLYRKYQIGKDSESIKSYLKTIYDNPLIKPNQIEQLKINTPKHIFEIEYMCNFEVTEQGVFNNIPNYINDKPILEGKRFCGIDIGRSFDFTVVIITNEYGQMIDILRINKMSWDLIEEKVVNFINKYNITSGLIEINNQGDVISERLIKRIPKLEQFKTTSQSKNPLIENLILNWDNGKITILSNPEILTEFESFGFTWNNSTRSIHYSGKGVHDDIIIATALSHWSLKNNKNKGIYSNRV